MSTDRHPLDDCDRGSHDIETRNVCPCGDVRRVTDVPPGS